ncbi:MAG: hypothetical protein ACRD11_04105 [Terriglobia bacterium]
MIQLGGIIALAIRRQADGKFGGNQQPLDGAAAGCEARDLCTKMVYSNVMAVRKRRVETHIRRSVTLPREVARQVEALAKRQRLSDNRVLVELIEQGIEAHQQKERAFFNVAERFRAATDPKQIKALGEELGRFVFGE